MDWRGCPLGHTYAALTDLLRPSGASVFLVSSFHGLAPVAKFSSPYGTKKRASRNMDRITSNRRSRCICRSEAALVDSASNAEAH